MLKEENKALIRRAIEARNTNDVEAFAAFFPTDWHEGVRRAFNGVTEAFPDVHITIEELIGEGDKIVSRWSTAPPVRTTSCLDLSTYDWYYIWEVDNKTKFGEPIN
jgi:hypothetical protein